MSGGEQQMLAMSRALASDPALLLLDELSMGLAPLIVDELYETVAQIAASGVSILCIEQFARTALRVSDYAAVMTGGRIVATGEPAEIIGHHVRRHPRRRSMKRDLVPLASRPPRSPAPCCPVSAGAAPAADEARRSAATAPRRGRPR